MSGAAPSGGRTGRRTEDGGALYWVVFTTIYALGWEDDREDRYLVAFEDDEAARSWRVVPGGLPMGIDVPSLSRVERVEEGWMEKWGHDQRVYSPEELMAEARRRWGRVPPSGEGIS